jgi:hypothetical protein
MGEGHDPAATRTGDPYSERDDLPHPLFDQTLGGVVRGRRLAAPVAVGGGRLAVLFDG